MPYLGNQAGNRFVASKAATQFSGNGSNTSFTLEHAVGSDEDILVSVDGVIQEPSVAYAVSNGTTLTFTAAPSNNSGNNIFVYYLFRTVGTVDHPATSSLQATDGTFTGAVTANAGVNIDNITIDGTEIDLSSGNLTIDVAGQLIVNSDSGQVVLQDDTVNWGNLQNSSGDFVIESLGTDKDIIFKGLDGSSTITALTLDMSDAGTASFNNKVLLGATSMDMGFGPQQLSVRTTGGTSPQILGSTNASTATSIIYNSNASAAVSMCDWRFDRANSTSYNFAIFRSDNNNDNEFIFRGNGDAFCDGAFSGGGADYAEYFEWADGNTDDEDRRGFTVVLDGNKIRKSTSEDNASSVIGVVSAMPAMIGDSGQLRWQGKYERDEWGSFILEEYTQTQWTDADGESKSYQTDKIPSDVTVPSNAVVTSTEIDGKTKLMRRKQNSSYDSSQTYIPREDRKEWDTVGLMGKLRVRVGQTIGDRWIKMREISDTVHEYLVR